MSVILKITDATGNATLNSEPGETSFDEDPMTQYYKSYHKLTNAVLNRNWYTIGVIAVHPIMDTGKLAIMQQ